MSVFSCFERYAFEPEFRGTYKDKRTDTEVMVKRLSEDAVIVSFWGMDNIRDALYVIPVFKKYLGYRVLSGTLKKFESVIDHINSIVKNTDEILVTGFSMGAAVAEVYMVYLMKKKHKSPKWYSLMSPYRAVSKFPFVVHVVDKDIISKWPFSQKRSPNEEIHKSPYRWYEWRKTHYHLKTLVLNSTKQP